MELVHYKMQNSHFLPSDFPSKVQSVLHESLLLYPEDGEERMMFWSTYNWRRKFYPELQVKDLIILEKFCDQYSVHVSNLIPIGTSIVESYNNHNLLFFTKKIYYTPTIWAIKMYASYLDWNCVPDWLELFVYNCCRRIMHLEK